MMTARRTASPTHLSVVPLRPRVPSPGAGAKTDAAPGPEPVLVGLLLCASDTQVIGVVREVLGWDGDRLSLRLLMDPGDARAESEAIVQIAMPAGPRGRHGLRKAPRRRAV